MIQEKKENTLIAFLRGNQWYSQCPINGAFQPALAEDLVLA